LPLRSGRFEVARAADFWDPLANEGVVAARSRIVGLAVLPGYEPGQVEAWAAEQTPPVSTVRSPAPGALLHYTSDPAEPLLNPSRRALPLPDTPGPRGDEIAL